MKKSLINFLNKYDYLTVIILWIIFQIIWINVLGFYFEEESEKYIKEAQFIAANHHLSEGRYLFYLTTILVIALSNLLKTGLYGASCIILIINLYAYVVFYKSLKEIFVSKIPPILIVAFLLAFWPFQKWFISLYSESVFYSVVMILFAKMISYKKLDLKFLSTIAFVALLVILSRPLGILFIPPILLFLYFKLSKKQKIFFYISLVFALVLLNKIVQIVFTTTPDWNMQRAFLEENLLCGMPPESLIGKDLDTINTGNPLYQLYYYVVHNFSHFSHIAYLRLKMFFLLTRDYYSLKHNIYLIINIGLIYTGIIIGIRKIYKQLPASLLAFIFVTIFLFALTIALQCDDWHSRFYITLMPLWVTLTAIGFSPKSMLRSNASAMIK